MIIHLRDRIDARNRKDQKIERKPFINRSLIVFTHSFLFVYVTWAACSEMNASTLIMIFEDFKILDPRVLFSFQWQEEKPRVIDKRSTLLYVDVYDVC